MNKVLIFLMAFVLPGTLGAQEVQSFSLAQAISYGVDNHRDMDIAKNEIQRAKEQMVEARSIGLPQINAGVDYNYFIKLPTSLIPAQFLNPMAPDGEFIELSFGTKNNLTAQATLSSLLFDGTYFVALKASKHYMDFARVNYENSRVQLKNAIKKAYLPPLLIQENIRTIEKNIRVLEKLLYETDEMYKNGFVEKMDVDKLALTVDNMKVLKKDLEKNRMLTLDALKIQMGFPLDQEIKLSESIEDLSTEMEGDISAIKLDYSKRSEFNILKKSEDLSNMNITRYQRGYWPSLSGFLNYQQVIQGDNLFNNAISTPTSVAGFSLKVPIFDGLMKKAKIQQAKLDLVDLKHQQALLQSGMDFQIKAARENYKNALENIQSRKKNLELAESIFSTSQEKYKEGVGSSLEIIQSEQSLHDSQQNYLTALYQFIVAKIDVQIALGKE